ncbi:hypothetical protein NM208_g7028 [Fusarium decemcellulare]|uniref:Uncharacterized protein n=1 Tax=Fusarium decemcellulare TaxID=57161 RepID=A0ACC1SAW8_9HYPO|nr:hypothetical protein NM208_g7028 [Fusarium decemcellulare]
MSKTSSHAPKTSKHGQSHKHGDGGDGTRSDRKLHQQKTPPSEEKRVCWLKDKNMLPSQIKNACVLGYFYRQRTAEQTPESYLEDTAQDLASLLVARRSISSDKQSPVLFIGNGFGCLILQRVMVILGEGEDPNEAGLLEAVAGIWFFDIPLQNLESFKSRPKPLPTAQISIQKWIKEYFPPNGDTQEGFNPNTLWTSFQNLFDQNRIRGLRVWLSKSTKTHAVHTYAYAYAYEPEVICIAIYGAARTSRMAQFHGPTDKQYLMLIEQMKYSLLVKACMIKDLESRLLDYIEQGYLRIKPKGSKALTALHVAADSGNYVAVTRLIRQGEADVGAKDKNMQSTSLHLAIRRALSLDRTSNSFGEDRDPYIKVIKELKQNTTPASLSVDTDRKKPWDYVPDGSEYDWIREIRDELSFQAIIPEPDPGWSGSGRSEIQQEACRTAEAYLAEFFKENDAGSRVVYSYQQSSATIDDLVYDDAGGLEQILDRRRGIQDKSRKSHCKWVHLPANNEQWVHDFFVKKGIHDTSMVDQRHQGIKTIDRYMIAQARRYRQAYIPSRQITDGSETGSTHKVTPADLRGNLQQTLSSTSIVSTSPAGNDDLDAVVLFMPLLSLEKHSRRKLLSQVFQQAEHPRFSPDDDGRPPIWELKETEKLLHGYLKSKKPLHCRRTLDQFSYYMLDSTEDRDNDQVALRWARSSDSAPILMIDQLWLWAMGNGTVLTCFPNTWEPNEKFSLRHKLSAELVNKSRNPILSTEDLIHFILRNSIEFFRREGPLKFKFQECFHSSINDVAEKQAKQFKRFGEIIHRLDQEPKLRAKESEELSSLYKETKLLVTIMDIQDELTIVKTVLMQQKEVLNKLFRLYSKRQNQQYPPEFTRTNSSKLPEKHAFSNDQRTGESDIPQENHGQTSAILGDSDLMLDTIGIVDENITVVDHMMSYAGKVQESLNHFLDLKQKHVNAWEARVAREAAQETQKQGTVILVFTIVTIIFLPLSFITAFFDLSVDAFPKDPISGEISWPLGQVSGYLFGASAALFIPLVLLALSINKIRNSLEAWLENRKSGSNSDNNNEKADDSDCDQDSDDEDDAASRTSCDSESSSRSSVPAPQSRFRRYYSRAKEPLSNLKEPLSHRFHRHKGREDNDSGSEDESDYARSSSGSERTSSTRSDPVPQGLFARYLSHSKDLFSRFRRNEVREESDTGSDNGRSYARSSSGSERAPQSRNSISSYRSRTSRSSSEAESTPPGRIHERLLQPIQNLFRRRRNISRQSDTESVESV